MRKGYKVTLSVLTIMMLITLTIGTSYSFYSVSDVQSDPNTIVTTCFELSFTDSNSISLNTDGSYAYPMSEANATSKLTPYQFTITNTCSEGDALKYDVTINTLTDTPSTLTDYVRYKLDVAAPTASAGTSAMLSSVYDSAYDLESTIKSSNNVDKTYRLVSGTLAPQETKTYQLYLWIDENAGNDVMGYTFNGKVLVYAYM